MSNRPYLGVGMKFPPQVNPATGRIVTADEEMSVKESVYLILMTAKTERLVRPNFGSNINEYTFMDIGATRTNILRREIMSLILEQEPRISEVNVEVEDQTVMGRVIININYMIAGSHTMESLVFPYYLEKELQSMIGDEFADFDQDNYEDYAEDID